MVETDPVLVFGSVLRLLREQARITQENLAQMVFCSPSLISAIERGNKPAKMDLVNRLDHALKTNGLLAQIWPIAANGHYPSWFAVMAELELDAIKIHEWELQIIPGLLQTAEYARAIMRAVRPRDSDEKIEDDVIARTARQEIFIKESPPMAWFVIDESVFMRPFGGKTVMHDQLIKLEKMSEQTNVIIQVMPFSVTDHPGMEGILRILEFSDSEPIWYTEGWYSGHMEEIKSEVAIAMTCFDLIKASALSPSESLKFIRQTRTAHYE